MYFTNSSGQLTESVEQISILPAGGAVANQGRHTVSFPADIYNGVLQVTTPDGLILSSRPLGISYDDGSNTVFIATLTNSTGVLVSSNQIVYPNAFAADFKADLVMTYRRGGFECDLVFRTQPPTSDACGLDPANSTLQLVTEFFDTQDPAETPCGDDEWFGLQDETLKFGKMTMTHGKAFVVNSSNSQLPSAKRKTSVFKSWLHLSGRTFLIEQVPLPYIADDLGTLPLTASVQKPEARSQKFASNDRQMPLAHKLVSDTNQILIASADLNKQPGVVLDYNEIDSGQTDYTFASGQTYFIGGWVSVSGTTTFGGGAVLKFPEDGSGSLGCTTIVCSNSAYSPTVFTSEDDNSVGDTLPWSTGSPPGGKLLIVYLIMEIPMNWIIADFITPERR
jgi:hypothetical protein